MRSYQRFFARMDWLLMAAMTLALPLVLLTPLLSGQLPGTNDAELHLHRLVSAILNLRAGIVWPRWSPNLHLGFGYPLGNFYAPGWHILGALLAVSGLPIVRVELIVLAVGIVLYPIGGYLFGRLLAGRMGALLGAAVFLYAPFRFYELFEQGNISQFIAMGLMPWVLWAIARCALNPRLSRVATAGLLLALLIVMHHPTAFEFVPLAALYALLVSWAAPERRYRLIAPLVALGLGLLLSAVYWLPALSELKYVRVQDAASGLYNIQVNFSSLTDLLAPNQRMDRAALNPPRPFNAGQIGLLLTLAGLSAALLSRDRLSRWQRAHLIGGAVVILGCLFLMTDRSLPLWQLFSAAEVLEFPWRLMGLLTVSTIPGAAIVLNLLPKRWRARALLAGLMILILSALPAMPPTHANVAEPAVITPGTSIRYERATGNLGAVATYEYTPIWSEQRPKFDSCARCYDQWAWIIRANKDSIPSDAAMTTSTGTHQNSTRFQITTPASFSLEMHQFYFPGWQLTLDGIDTPIRITSPYGLMAITIPAGTHTVEAWYGGTAEQHAGDLLSVIGLGLCGILFAASYRRTHKFVLFPTDVARYRRLGILITAALGVFAVGIQPITDAFREYGTAAQPANVTQPIYRIFADSQGTPQIELVGIDAQATAEPGNRVTVRLYWHALRKLDRDWRVALKLQDPLHSEDWANSDNDVPGGYNTADWPLDRYVVDAHMLSIRADAPPFLGDLTITIYNLHTGAQLKPDVPAIGQMRLIDNRCDKPPVNASVRYGNQITLKGYTLNDQAGHVNLDLYWHVEAALGGDYVLFIHTMGGAATVGNADTEPLAAYPTNNWQAGQCLHGHYTFDVPANVDRLVVGFYARADGAPLIASGQPPLENNGLVIPLR